MKTCFKCRQEKPRSDFYAHPKMADGLFGKCKECARADSRATRLARPDYYKEYERSRQKRKNETRARSPNIRKRAWRIVERAVKSGDLIPWPVCAVPDCSRKPHAHHPDYSSPLGVVWLCPSHHRLAHAASKP